MATESSNNREKTAFVYNIVELQCEASVLRILAVSTIILINAASAGCAVAFSTTAAVVYASPNATTLPEALDEDEISWLMSIVQISMIISTILSGIVIESLGRKKALILSEILILCGWATVYFAPGFVVLLAGRFVMGIGIGIVFPANLMYLSEIALIRFRSNLSITNALMANAAFIYSLVLSATLAFDTFILVSAALPALFLLLSYFVPESPLWLMKKGKVDLAEQSMIKLRGPKYFYSVELNELEVLVATQSSVEVSLLTKLKQLRQRTVIMPVLMMVIMFTFQPLSGSDTVSIYSLAIFKRAKVAMNNHILSILVQSAFTLGYLISAVIMAHIPRKVQFICSGLFMAASLATLGFTLKNEGDDSESWKAISEPLLPVCVICTGLAYGLGLGPVLFALLGEVLPPKIKGLACALVLTTRNFSTFVNLKTFPTIVNSMGLHSLFWMHSGVCVVACVLAYFLLPETQGKTLTELSLLYEKKVPPSSGETDPNWKPMTKEEEANLP